MKGTYLPCFGFLLVMPVSGSVITSGAIDISGILPSGSFTLSGDSFTATGTFSLGAWGPIGCFPCAAGTALSVNGFVSGNDFGGGSAAVDGTTYSAVTWGDLNAMGPSIFDITGPPIVLGSGPGSYTGTFTFAGSLCGTATFFSVPNPCVVKLPLLTGSGQVTVTIGPAGIPGLVQYVAAGYEFSEPEPPGILLAISGIGLLFRFQKSARSVDRQRRYGLL